jgi:hypothetical protein
VLCGPCHPFRLPSPLVLLPSTRSIADDEAGRGRGAVAGAPFHVVPAADAGAHRVQEGRGGGILAGLRDGHLATARRAPRRMGGMHTCTRAHHLLHPLPVVLLARPDPSMYVLPQEKHPSALAEFESVLAAADGKQIVMFLDYDGTLSPIVEDPDTAVMTEEVSVSSQVYCPFLRRAVPAT